MIWRIWCILKLKCSIDISLINPPYLSWVNCPMSHESDKTTFISIFIAVRNHLIFLKVFLFKTITCDLRIWLMVAMTTINDKTRKILWTLLTSFVLFQYILVLFNNEVNLINTIGTSNFYQVLLGQSLHLDCFNV